MNYKSLLYYYECTFTVLSPTASMAEMEKIHFNTSKIYNIVRCNNAQCDDITKKSILFHIISNISIDTIDSKYLRGNY